MTPHITLECSPELFDALRAIVNLLNTEHGSVTTDQSNEIKILYFAVGLARYNSRRKPTLVIDTPNSPGA